MTMSIKSINLIVLAGGIMLIRAFLTTLILLIFSFPAIAETHDHSAMSSASESKGQIWTCSMHPNIRMNAPGKCPICEMDLIPLESSSMKMSSDSAPIVKLSPYAEKLAEVKTVPVKREFVAENLDFSGRIEYDETRLARISARFPGRVEKLYVNYTGIPVKAGEHIAELFSPELMVLQREYLLALKSSSNSSDSLLPSGILSAAKGKMRLWGLTDSQIDAIAKRGTVSEQMTLLAPINGIVVEKNIVSGQYFKEGDPLFTISDVSHLWLILDVYESDIRFLRYGQKISFRVEAFPSDSFNGRIAYISPEMNRSTRTVPVRVNLENPSGRLRPGMLARAAVSVVLDSEGAVQDDSLAGKWISPMHPEIIKDAPGNCDICGMPLVPAESMGYTGKARNNSFAPLLIPASAPLITGKRAFVYVKHAPGEYMGHLVTLGARAGDYYTVKSGLKEGDEVVYNGNMKIDSAAQIAGLPSMTSPENFEEMPASSVSMDDQAVYGQILAAYFKLADALVAADLKAAVSASDTFSLQVSALKDGKIREKLASVSFKKSDIKAMRESFASLSGLLYTVYKEAGLEQQGLKAYRAFCPMAFDDKGAYWLQDNDKLVNNPYFGHEMLRCGEFK